MTLCVHVPTPPGVVVLHGAAVDFAGRACIFLGPSGTGKSTLCGLVDGLARVVADDKLFVIAHGASWSVMDATERLLGSPMTAAEARALRGVEVGAILRLYQAERPRLERLPPLAVCRELLDAYFDFRGHRHYNVQEKKRVLAALAAVARAVPGYAFHFDLSDQAGEMVARVIGGQQPLDKRTGE